MRLGLKLATSDSQVSFGVLRVWEALARRGFVVTVSEKALLDAGAEALRIPDETGATGRDGPPVLTTDPSARRVPSVLCPAPPVPMPPQMPWAKPEVSAALARPAPGPGRRR